jgi:tRNA (guanine10-N2)-dimethyltransferase
MHMKLLFELSGEHPDLPKAELFSVLSSEGITYKVVYEWDKVLVVDTDSTRSDYLSRLGMTLKAGRNPVITKSAWEVAEKLSTQIPKDRSMVVRSKSHTLEQEIGAEFYLLGYVIDLEEADEKVIAYRTWEGFLAAINVALKRDFSKRRPQFRPYFHPTSMHPKLARALVNLANVKKGSTILDPFCGTGGILIEAGLMGMLLKGSDIDSRMVSGCRRNMELYGLFGELEKVNALEIPAIYEKVDAIVTDPPYARCSYVSEGRSDMGGFYEKFLESAGSVLKPGGRLVMMLPKQYHVELGGFTLMQEHYIKVHKSLTRRIIVLEKGQ